MTTLKNPESKGKKIEYALGGDREYSRGPKNYEKREVIMFITRQCTVGKYGGSVYIMVANNASFAPSKLNIVLLITPQGLQLRI